MFSYSSIPPQFNHCLVPLGPQPDLSHFPSPSLSSHAGPSAHDDVRLPASGTVRTQPTRQMLSGVLFEVHAVGNTSRQSESSPRIAFADNNTDTCENEVLSFRTEPSAVYCNCPVDKTQRPCSTVEAKLRNADVAPQVPEMSSEYIDSHTIKVRIAEVPNAFAYIFEYSTISTQPDEWYFAGASTTSSLKFTILDPCRDYQFRVIVVIRSSDPDQLFLVFRPRAIPVNLPPFVLGSQQMTVDVATASADTSSNTIKLYVKWTLPKGYIDADVYGYESPSLYPIQCSTPEGELPQPKIEIVKGGGRLAVSLPMSVLEDRCRMWVEVKMLPKCVRLEPFIIQKNVEIDCDKSADLEVCSRGGKPSAERATNKPRRRSERNPACTEVVDIFGNKGKVKIMWEQPGDTTPLYYHVRYGPAEIKGVSPFLSWQLSTKRDVKVDSNVLSLTLHIPENQQFGVQVCAIYSERRKRPKFGVVHVIPFECLGCPVGVEKTDGPLQCGECGRLPLDQSLAKKARKPVSPDLAPHTPVSPVFDTTSSDPWKTAATTEQADSGDKEFGSVKSKSQNPSVSEQTVFRMETDLVVAGKDPTNTRPQNIASGNTHHSPMSPISIEKAERIIEGGTESSSQESQERRSQSSLRYTPKPSAKPKTRVITTTLSENKEDKEDWVEYVEDTTLRTTTEEITASTVPFELSPEAAELMKELSNLPDIGQIGGKDMNTTTSTGSNARVVDVDAEMGLIETNTKSRIGESRKKGKMSMKNDDKDLIIGKANERIELTKELEESVRNLEKALAAEGRTLRVDLEDEFKTLPITEPMNEATTTTESTTRRKIDLTDEVKRIIEDAEEDLNDKLSSVATTSADLRLHEKSKKCMLYNGAICEFGCETRKSCYCPLDTHVKMENGLCMSRDLVSQTTCLPKRDINATWDPVLHNVMV
ncbi:hypothetical protein WR25_03550 isoform D [Diploscapter pachys]|uniref:Fibronectin type-III domain-containing protein n=1 Tax=Diploscapter pachys TaxID=2018661 RepID=A0A2A2K4C1_9BILA|nr:hypothetical protein WR25_03550 isoform C [Diploscapter pachys]PAV68828.1 hypothetical protein WR25_03550 isoform D [Diploscapter pachys]